MSNKVKKKESADSKTVKANELIEYIKTLIAKGNVRRLILRKPSGKKVLEIPLSAGIGIGGVLLFIAPILVAISSVAALMAEFKVEVVRADNSEEE